MSLCRRFCTWNTNVTRNIYNHFEDPSGHVTGFCIRIYFECFVGASKANETFGTGCVTATRLQQRKQQV